MKTFVGYSENGKPLYKYSADDPRVQQDLQAGYKPYGGTRTASIPTGDESGMSGTLDFGDTAVPERKGAIDQALGVLGGIGGAAVGAGDFLTKTFVPRTRKFVEDVGRMGYESLTDPAKAAEYQDKYRMGFGSPEQIGNLIYGATGPLGGVVADVATGGQYKSPMLGMVAPAGGEIASYAIPTAGFGKAQSLMKPLQRMGASALAGVAGGAVHGATSPEEMGVVDRFGQAAKEGIISGLTSLALAGGIEGLRWAADKAQGLGEYFARRIISPASNPNDVNAIKKEYDAIRTMFDKTRAVTPEGISMQTGDAVAEVGNKLNQSVANSPAINTVSNIQDKLLANVRKSLPNSVVQSPEAKQGFADVVVALTGNADNAPSGDFTVTARQVLQTKRVIGDMLRETGAWQKTADLTPDQMVMKNTYFTLKDILEEMAPESAFLSEMEHRLLALAEGAYKTTHRLTSGTRSAPLLSPSNVPILGMLPNIAEPVNMAIARGLYKGGAALEGAMANPVTQAAIRKIGGFISGAGPVLTNP